MSVRIRTGYSFRNAVGTLSEVMSRLKECGFAAAPITDTASTFGFVRWAKLCAKNGIKPIFGVELDVSPSIEAKKPIGDPWTFLATDDLKGLNTLITISTRQFRYRPLLSYEQAMTARGVIRIVGRRTVFDADGVCDLAGCHVAASPAVRPAYLREAVRRGLIPVAACDNTYTRAGDAGFYQVVVGRNAGSQTYPQHILADDEWLEAMLGADHDEATCQAALTERDRIYTLCTAALPKGSLVAPERPAPLRTQCEEGAARIGCDLSAPVYAARLTRELDMIAAKNFEDYFYLVGDLVRWARKRMAVGPARGSSCGSLVCYLLGITTIDPLKYDLLFERFIDINRNDLPDIDVDFSHQKRVLVFDYLSDRYGKERVARLGTVTTYQVDSAINETAGAMGIPKWRTQSLADSIVKRFSGDSRAIDGVTDAMQDTVAGRALLLEHPEMLIAGRLQGHPRNGAKHAAGVIITDRPISEYIAVDARVGATQCDKKDAEDLDLLKIDALGLVQLSIFEDALRLAGLPHDHLDGVPLDDPKVFQLLNDRKFAGVFQFEGPALKNVAQQIKFTCLDDIVAVTALARPGPMVSGGTVEWCRRKNSGDITYPHPLFEPYLKDSLGVVIFQETIMSITREVGGLSWDDVTALRKAMSKSLGKEYFDQYGDRFIKGSVEKGVPENIATKLWDDLCAYGSWCVSGDTVLRNPYPSQNAPATFTIRELYERQGYTCDPGKFMEAQGRLPKRQKLFCYNGNTLFPTENITVTYSGIKPTYTVTLKDGKTIRTTKEHELLTDAGMRRLEDISVGTQIAVKGKTAATVSYSAVTSIEYYGEEETYDVSMPEPHHNFLANNIVVHNCFNKSHSVAYGIVSYYCFWMKVHYPLQYAAATLKHYATPESRIRILRELHDEGISYLPVHIDLSTDEWRVDTVDDRQVLIGPVSNVIGIGPMLVKQIMSCRMRGETLPARASKLLTNPKTDIDTLWPIRDAFAHLMPDPTARNIYTKPSRVIDVQESMDRDSHLFFVTMNKINPRDENEEVRIAKRDGKRIEYGPTAYLNCNIRDDSGQLFAKINCADYDRMAKPIIDRGKPNKALYAIKGNAWGDETFRGITITAVRYIGDIGGEIPAMPTLERRSTDEPSNDDTEQTVIADVAD